MYAANPEGALELAIKYGSYFLLPGMILFLLFFVVLCGAQISAFAKGMTLYPRWCWIFSLPVGMLIAMLFKVFGESEPVNALTAGWISIGNIWMFGGLLVTMKLARREKEK